MKRFSLILVFANAILSCSPKHIPFSEDPVLNPPQKVVESVSFNELYLKVLEPKCIGCHGTSGKINLESIDQVRRHIAQLKNSVLVTRRMPKLPYLPLSNAELELVSAWIKANGPDHPINGDLAPVIPNLEPTFGSISQKILIPKCVACHRPGGEAPLVPLDSVADLVDSPLEIVMPGNPDESGLILVVKPGARKKMPPLTGSISALQPFEIETIRAWIANGAKE